MKSYLNYFKLRFITNLQYRAAALAGISTQIFFGLVFIMVYLAFYDSNGSANYPMEWNNLVSYIWLNQAFYALVYPYEKDQELLEMIKNGNLAYELIRPQNFFSKFYIKMLAKKVVSTMLRCIPVIIVAFLLPEPIGLTLPITFSHFVLFIFSILTSCLLVSSLIITVHLITMFTLDSRGILSIYSVICEVFSGGTIPIPFFPDWLKSITYLLPFRYIADFPFRIYSGDISLNEGVYLLLQSLIWIIVIFIIGQIISKFALRKAVIQGG